MNEKQKAEIFDKLIEFVDEEYNNAIMPHYSDGSNQYRTGYKICLENILEVIAKYNEEWNQCFIRRIYDFKIIKMV